MPRKRSGTVVERKSGFFAQVTMNGAQGIERRFLRLEATTRPAAEAELNQIVRALADGDAVDLKAKRPQKKSIGIRCEIGGRWLSVEDVARIAGVTTSTILQRIGDGKLGYDLVVSLNGTPK
jgi:hypothetical protein